MLLTHDLHIDFKYVIVAISMPCIIHMMSFPSLSLLYLLHRFINILSFSVNLVSHKVLFFWYRLSTSTIISTPWLDQCWHFAHTVPDVASVHTHPDMISWVDVYKYLGCFITSDLKDDRDIRRQVRAIYCRRQYDYSKILKMLYKC